MTDVKFNCFKDESVPETILNDSEANCIGLRNEQIC